MCPWDVWNVGSHALQTSHQWSKLLGTQTPTLDNIRPFIEQVLNQSSWQMISQARGPKGKIIGEILEAEENINGETVWVRGFKNEKGIITVNNAGVR